MTITKTIDTEQIKQSTDLRELAERYTELRKETAQSLCGPCPKCGGTDRFWVKSDRFACRQCNPSGGDVFAFFMWKDGVDFKGAVATITNAPMPSSPVKRTPATKPAQTEAWRAAEWQRENVQLIQQAHRRLLDDADQQAQAGRAYLLGRGLEPFTCKAFGLGFAMPWHSQLKRYEPAIAMPWYTITGTLRGVRFRFLKQYQIGTREDGSHIKSDKQTSVEGLGQFTGALFGSQAIGGNIPSLATLIICEGELNAVSIWQLAHASHCNVLSLGSESAHMTPAMAAYAGQYARVLVWLDKAEKAQRVMADLPGSYGIKSPGGQDANDLLQVGKLGGFLALHRFQAAQNAHEQRRVLYDLQDGQAGADESTDEVISYIGKTLGPAPTAQNNPGARAAQ
jgi:hypothetical protein